MAQFTDIGWCDSTINPTSGCDGCELYAKPPPDVDLREWLKKQPCYAAHVHENRLAPSLPHLYATTFSEVRMIPGRMSQAAKWKDLRGTDRPDKPWLNGKPRHIFVGDMGDFLSENVTDEFLEEEVLNVIKSSPGQRHVWMLLTKRPARLAALSQKWGGLPDNVIAMTTATNRRTLDLRVKELLKVRCKTRGLSLEPLREQVDVNWIFDPVGYVSCGGYAECTCQRCRDCQHWPRDNDGERASVDLVICGCESGPRRKPMSLDIARELRDQCAEYGVAFFLKQIEVDGKVTTDAWLDGKQHHELPETRR